MFLFHKSSSMWFSKLFISRTSESIYVFNSIRNKINVLGTYIYIHHSDQMINLWVHECVLLLLRLLFFFFCFYSLPLSSHTSSSFNACRACMFAYLPVYLPLHSLVSRKKRRKRCFIRTYNIHAITMFERHETE